MGAATKILGSALLANETTRSGARPSTLPGPMSFLGGFKTCAVTGRRDRKIEAACELQLACGHAEPEGVRKHEYLGLRGLRARLRAYGLPGPRPNFLLHLHIE